MIGLRCAHESGHIASRGDDTYRRCHGRWTTNATKGKYISLLALRSSKHACGINADVKVDRRNVEMLFVRGDGVILVCSFLTSVYPFTDARSPLLNNDHSFIAIMQRVYYAEKPPCCAILQLMRGYIMCRAIYVNTNRKLRSKYVIP